MELQTNLDFVNLYFTEEKIEALFFMILGITAISGGLIFLCIVKYSFYKGMAFPLLLIGLLQLIVGTTIYIRSDKDIVKVEQIMIQEPQKISSKELPRIETVIKNFRLYTWIEIIGIIAGISLFIFFYHSPQTFWKGFGLGLILQTTLILALDVVAAKRAEAYFCQLNEFSKQLKPLH